MEDFDHEGNMLRKYSNCKRQNKDYVSVEFPHCDEWTEVTPANFSLGPSQP